MLFKPFFHAATMHRIAWPAARIIIVVMLILGAMFVPTHKVSAAPGTYWVNRTDDIAPRAPGVTCLTQASSDCTLREAVIKANANPGSTIRFDGARTNGTPIVLTRTGNDANANAGDLDINATTTIIGNGAANTIIQGASDASYTNSIGDKIFGVNQDGAFPSLVVSFSGMTIRYGDNAIPYNDPTFAFTGGGVDVWQTGAGNSATFTECTISYNRNRYGWGGGFNFDQDVTASGSLTLTNVTFDHNQTTSTAGTSDTREGGGLSIHGYNPIVTITNSSFTNNSTTDPDSAGGGLYIAPSYKGTIAIHNSTFDNNTATAGSGGGIAIFYYSSSTYYPVDITIDQNTTVTNNTAGNVGGGIYIDGAYLNNTAQLSNLLIRGNSALEGGGVYTGLANATVQYSRIVNNSVTTGTGTGLYVDDVASTVTATRNWWGCSTGPSSAPCDRTNTTAFNPWLRNQLTSASGTTLVTNQTSAMTASFRTDSSGADVSANLDRISGLPVTWNSSNPSVGSFSGQVLTIQADGRATAAFTARAAGSTSLYARVDNDNTSPISSNVLSFTVNKGNTTTAIANDTPDPSGTTQAVNVDYTVTDGYGNTPTIPTGNVTVSDGINSCTGTVAAGSCALTLATPGNRTLVATYAGDANFNGSVSAGVSHMVNQAPAITSANNKTFTVGSPGTFTVTTSGYPAGASMTIGASGDLPGNVTFNDNHDGTATLAGTPGAGTGGDYPITITASNGTLPDASQSFTLTVNQAPSITSAVTTTFSETLAGAFTVTTSGFPAGASMLISETGALPGGVTFTDNHDGTASLAGAPALGTRGDYHITITANNGVAPNATQNFTLVVQPNLAITSADHTAFIAGAAGSFTVTTIGIPTPALSISDSLPGGVTFTDNGDGTATLAGTPPSGVDGSYPFTITAHNGVAADATQAFTLTVNRPDTTIISINRTGSSSTHANSVSWTVTFANAMQSLASANFTLDNGGLGGSPAITTVTPDTALPAADWTITASTGTGDGTLSLNLANDTGLWYHVTTALPFTGQVYTIDKTAPKVSSIVRQSPAGNPTNADVLTFRVTFNEPVTSVGASSFVATGTTTTIDASSVTAITPNLVFDFSVNGTLNGNLPNFNGTVGLDVASSPTIQDLAGNTLQVAEPMPAATNDQTYTVDNTPPTVTINQSAGQADPSNASPINFTAIFNEPVGGSFTSGDVTLGGTAGATTAAVTEIAPFDSTTYNVAVSGMTGDGTVSASIPAGVVTGSYGETNLASTSTDSTVTYDITPPTVTVHQAAGQADPAGASPIHFTAVFSEAIDPASFTDPDITLGGTANPSTAVVTETAPTDGTTFTVTVSGMTVSGTVTASIPANQVTDLAGNGNNASTTTTPGDTDRVDFIYAVPPVITEGGSVHVDLSKNSSPIPFDLTLHATDANADPLTWSVQTPPGSGAADVEVGPGNSAQVDYTPSLDYTGDDSFVVRVSDGNGGTDDITIDVTIQGPPAVSKVGSAADTGDGQVDENEYTAKIITRLLVVFNHDMNAAEAAVAANYTLVRGAATPVTINHVAYDIPSRTTTLDINGGVALAEGKYTLTVKSAIPDVLGDSLSADFVRIFNIDTTAIQLSSGGITLPSQSTILDGATIGAPITEILVSFVEDAANPAGDILPEDVTNPANYLLVRPGLNAAFDTTTCAAGRGGDDVAVPTGPVSYTNGGGAGPFVARVHLNNGTGLENGLYRLFVCGTTSITDLAGNPINNGADYQLSFTVRVFGSSGSGDELDNPATGFAPGITTVLPPQPVEKVYRELDRLWLEIHPLGVQADITSVPLLAQGWDLTWLNQQVGWLEGTAYPSWNGNTVLTAHNYTPDGLAGPFAALKDLKYDQEIIIHIGGLKYAYAVRMNSTVAAGNTYWLAKHEELAWVTLITCEQYDEKSDTYLYRRVVRAVLTSVQDDK